MAANDNHPRQKPREEGEGSPTAARRVLAALFLSYASVGSPLPACKRSVSWLPGAGASLGRRWVMLAAFLACRHLPVGAAEPVKSAAASFADEPTFARALSVLEAVECAARAAGLCLAPGPSPSIQPSAAAAAQSMASASEAVYLASEALAMDGVEPRTFQMLAEAMVGAAGVGAIDDTLCMMWSDVSDACSVCP